MPVVSKTEKQSIQRLSVIVPKNPFVQPQTLDKKHCLCAFDVVKLMEWWPGTPHSPHRDPIKVTAIQRSLDWKRVVQIAAYLLQEEIIDVPKMLNKYFRDIYEPKKYERGREWPPNINKVIGFQRSEFPTFSNVLVHINGAKIKETKVPGAAQLIFNEKDRNLKFSVIDGQHRINGAYLAIKLRREKDHNATWEIPAEVFLELDLVDEAPRRQAQIFIDVNFYQKKVDRSLVADLFPTARGERDPLDRKERAQDIGRKLMLEKGPLIGMIQIPGIKYGVKDVITLATLNSAIEDVLETMENNDIKSLETQTDFLAQCLTAWLEASGWVEEMKPSKWGVNPQNVAYQGRVLVSIITLIPAMIWKLKTERVPFISEKAELALLIWLREIIKRANLLEDGVFLSKNKFKKHGYVGSGGVGRFRDSLWAVVAGKHKINNKMSPEEISKLAKKNHEKIWQDLGL